MEKVELIAEETKYPDCAISLFICGEGELK